MIPGRCSLLLVGCWLFVVGCCSLLVARWLLAVVPLVVCSLLIAVCGVLLCVVCCFVFRASFFGVSRCVLRCLVRDVWCFVWCSLIVLRSVFLSVGCCLLVDVLVFGVCCSFVFRVCLLLLLLLASCYLFPTPCFLLVAYGASLSIACRSEERV